MGKFVIGGVVQGRAVGGPARSESSRGVPAGGFRNSGACGAVSEWVVNVVEVASKCDPREQKKCSHK